MKNFLLNNEVFFQGVLSTGYPLKKRSPKKMGYSFEINILTFLNERTVTGIQIRADILFQLIRQKIIDVGLTKIIKRSSNRHVIRKRSLFNKFCK